MLNAMKRILFLLLILSLSLQIRAQKTDTVRFVYVVQNPLFYGQDARSWFEMEGLKDKSVQKQINDTLRKAFFKKTEFDSAIQYATLRGDKKTPKGFTDFTFFNGQTYGNGWIRFKNSDSLVRLTDADGYYGSGKNIGGFAQEIADGTLAWIGIHTTRFMNEGMESERSINLSFDLRTGQSLPSQFIVRIDPAKRPELELILETKVKQSLSEGTYFRDGKIVGSDKLSDTVIVTMAQLIRRKRGEKSEYSNTICRYYEAAGVMISNNQNFHWRPPACLTLDEAIPFFINEDWSKLQNL